MSYYNGNNAPDVDPTGEVISWVIVFIMMFAFPPVGLLLLFRKLRRYAKPVKNTTKYQGASSAEAARQAAARDAEAARQASARNAGTAHHTTYTHGAAPPRSATQTPGAAAQHTTYAPGTTGYHTTYAPGATAPPTAQVPPTAQAPPTAHAAGAAAWETGGSARNAYSQHAGYPGQTSSDTFEDIAREFSVPYNSKQRKDKKQKRLDRKSGKFVSTILLLISIPMFIIGASGIANAAQNYFTTGSTSWFDLIMGSSFLIGGIITFFSRNISVRRIIRYKNYYAYAMGRGVVPIPDLALAAGVSAKVVTRDIQTMLIDGYFDAGAYIDSELNSLVLSPEAAKAAREAAKTGTTAQKAEAPHEAIPVNPYMAIILELRELKVNILDITISDKVDRIEGITAKIFRTIEENPQKQPQIRRFMSYYLPTTLKLLRSYATLEKQGIGGENITSTKESIGRILDTLATGYEQQLDQLFKSDAIDIASDITVLENLMQQDGLTSNRPELKTPELKTMEGSTW